MSRFLMTIAYDGGGFQGCQVQGAGRTVQGEVEGALSRLAKGGEVRIHGSGRTDSGVHARGQRFHFDAPREDFDAGGWMRALNGNLPKDVRVMEGREVREGFHARFDAVEKEYRYFIQPGSVMLPDLRFTRLLEPCPLSLERMRAVCEILQGEHDFTAFSADRGDGLVDHARDLRELSLETMSDGGLKVRAVANGFLYKMVRRLTGAVLRVGRGEMSPEEVGECLRRGERTRLIPTVPPQGLFLWRVVYPEDSCLD